MFFLKNKFTPKNKQQNILQVLTDLLTRVSREQLSTQNTTNTTGSSSSNTVLLGDLGFAASALVGGRGADDRPSRTHSSTVID